MKTIVYAYLAIGFVLGPFVLRILRVHRKGFLLVLFMWLLVTLVWPMGVAEVLLFPNPEDRW